MNTSYQFDTDIFMTFDPCLFLTFSGTIPRDLAPATSGVFLPFLRDFFALSTRATIITLKLTPRTRAPEIERFV